MTRRIALVLAFLLAALVPAGAAWAATTDKAAVLARWTQPTAASYAAWNAARLDRSQWAAYGFDWSTDHCSVSPEKPLGFDFTLACWRHDFGYRNYRAAGTFGANRDRVDDTFHADMKRVCAQQRPVFRAACYSVAWTYYQAVHVFGGLSNVKQSDLERARVLL